MASSTQVRRLLLELTGDDADASEKIASIKAKADELKESFPELKARIETSEANAKLKVLRDELAKAGTGIPPIVPEVDDAPADERITALQASLGALRESADMALELNVDDDVAEAKLLRLQAQLEALNETIARPEVSDAGIAKAKADLADLQLRLTALTTVPEPPIPVEVDPAPAVAGIDEVRARLDALALRAGRVEIRADDADANAKLLSVQARLAELGDKVARPDISVAGVARARADIASVALQLDALGGKSGGGGGGLGGLVSGGLMSPAGLAGIAGGALVAAPEAGALATGLSAAGLGVGAFAALAVPAFGKVHTAYTQIQSDEAAYNRALTSSGRKTAMEHLQQDWKSLNPAESGALRGVQQLTGEFRKMSTAFEPTAFKVFDEALGIANQLMPYVAQFATAAAPAIEQALGGLSKFTGSGEFKYFMNFLSSLSGPVITAVGSGLHGLGDRLMTLMEMFSKKDVVNGINIAFRILGFTLQLLQGLMLEGMDAWDLLTEGLHNGAHVFDDARHWVASLGHDVAHVFDDARHDVASFAHGVATDFDSVRHAGATLEHDTAAHFDEIRHDIAQWAGDVRHDADNVIGFFERLPGEVVDGLSRLPGDLERVGSGAMTALWRGLESEAGQVIGDAEGWAHDIANALGGPFGVHFSEPSEAEKMVRMGRNVAAGLNLGITQGLGASPALRRLEQLTGAGSAAGGGGGGGSRGAPLQIEWIGGQADGEFMTWLKKNIRLRGGDPTVVGS